MRETVATVTSCARIAEGISLLTLRAPDIAREARAGQFVHLQAEGVFLRRPISLYAVAGDEIRLVIQEVGAGTRALCACRAGEGVRALGPCGTGFPVAGGAAGAGSVDAAADRGHAVADAHAASASLPISPIGNRASSIGNGWDARGTLCYLVGGGVGVAPLYELARTLRAHGHRVESFVGYRSAAHAYAIDDLSALGPVHIATDDGTLGARGTSVDRLAQALSGGKPDVVYACGPTPMLRALQALCAREGLTAYASLEEHMGCGVGACLTCNCRIRVRDGWSYKRVCADGPVFPLSEVMFDG